MYKNRESIGALVNLIGEENEAELKKGITKLFLERIESDLDDYSNYILYPPDFSDTVNDALESVQNKVKKMYKDAVVEINSDYIEKMKAYMSKEFNADKILRTEVLNLAKRYYWLSNDHGKERKFANELFDVLKMTQEEIDKELESKNV